MGKGTVVYKIIENHVEGEVPAPGNEIRMKIDQTLCQDATGTMAFLELEAMGVDKVKTDVSVQYVDHNTGQYGPENHNDHLYLQSVAAAKGVHYSRPGNGICHQVHLERFGQPGKTLLGSDSHTPTNGGIGMLAIGAGGLDVASAMAGIPFKMTAPRVIGVELTGKLQPWCAAKDVILHLLSILSTKGNVGCAVEYFGEGVKTLSVPERATITNMGAELGVTGSVFPSDEITHQFLEAQGRGAQWCELGADEGAVYDRVIQIDLSTLEPLAACPSSPDNIRKIKDLGNKHVSQVVIGSCTNSSLKDLKLIASVLDGRIVPEDVCLAIAPGSRQVMSMLAEDGDLARIINAGARILESACGPCIGQGMSPAEDEVTVRTFNRNFAGRTGTKGDQCYLVSVETALATALTGALTDPRDLDIEYPTIAQPASFTCDDRMIIEPPEDNEKVEIIRKSTIGKPPVGESLPENIKGEVVIKVGDKITTDHIMPAGTFLKLRSNIPEYAKVVFNCFNEEGKPTFAQRAIVLRDQGIHGIVVGGDSYGQGSSREHAAACPVHLGVKVVIAKSIERIHAANLVNFGILPLLFDNHEDYELIQTADGMSIDNVREALKNNEPIDVRIIRNGETYKKISCHHTLSEEDVEVILAGGRLSMVASS